jgi:cytochrome c oxidase subunit 3
MQKPIPETEHYSEYDSFAFHPHNVLLFLLLLGISALFLSMSAAFVYTRVQSQLPPLQLPPLFLLNTLLLLGSSATMLWAKKSYLEDHTPNYQKSLLATIALSLIFLVAQVFAWQSLFRQNVFIDSDNSAGYLYVISGLHFLHVIAGLPFLGAFLWKAYKKMVDPVSVLVYFSDPEKRLKLRLLTIYWHFLDGLWVYLVLFFYINALLK